MARRVTTDNQPSEAQIQEETAPKQCQNSQATVQEHTDPKLLAYIESHSNQNAPTFTDNSALSNRRPSEQLLETETESDSTQRENTEPDEGKKSDGDRRGTKVRNYGLLGLIILLILGLALGLGLGLTLPKHHHRNEIVESGAINGSGVVSKFPGDRSSNFTTYTQRYDGLIVRSDYLNGVWTSLGGNSSRINTTGTASGDVLTARNGTPLTALSYVNAGELNVRFVSLISTWPFQRLT